MGFCLGWTLKPFHENSHRISFKVSGYLYFPKNFNTSVTVFSFKPLGLIHGLSPGGTPKQI